MAWTVPQHSKAKVDAAGKALLAGFGDVLTDYDGMARYLMALDVISNWRSSHSFPLNTFQNGLRRRGKRIDPAAIPAQRIKRLASINMKLRRFPGLRLSQLQDIGGCRLVLSDVSMVQQIVNTYKTSDIRHKLATADDYIEKPQKSGYRGVHLIYKYESDKSPVYNGLKIELQIRSALQHAWATAVETVGTFLKQSLKSSMGEAEWLRFFALMGSAIANQEGGSPVANTPANYDDLRREIYNTVENLDVISRLSLYGSALRNFEQQEDSGQYHILMLDPYAQSIRVRSFGKGRLGVAQAAYLELEKQAEGTAVDVVLVSVDSVAALRKAYPNYFLDTRIFISVVNDVLSGRRMEADQVVVDNTA